MAGTPSILRTAHGAAAEGGALLVAETPPLDEYPPPDAARTERGLALRKANGRPFQPGNKAASGRGPSLTHIVSDPDAPEERRRTERKAANLKRVRIRELSVQYGITVSSGVKAELKAWSLDLAWSDVYFRAGNPAKGANLAEKASAHQLKAVGYAEREAGANRPKRPADPLAAFRLPAEKRP